MPRNFKYASLVTEEKNSISHMKALEEIKSDCLKDSANAFRVNMERGMSFAMLPTELVFQSINNARLSANAMFRVHKIGAMTLREQMDIPFTADVLLEFQKECGENERMSPEISNRLRVEVGVGHVIEFLRTSTHMQASMDAMFTSIVLESWLFFEALCSDLWVSVVDSGGPVISARILANQSWESGKEQMLASNTVGVKSNAKTHPGSYRREIGQVSFQKLRSIIHYFKISFGDECGKIFDQSASGYIRALNAVRNCIAHSAGKVDSHFRIATGDRFPEFASLSIGNPILLDGEIVKKLRNAAVETGLALLNFVDALLLKGD